MSQPGIETPPEEAPVEFGKRGEREEAEIDMTPMVDVTFLLLIFFMVTAAFSLQKSLEIPNPQQDEASTQAEPQPPEEDPLAVTVQVDQFNIFHVLTADEHYEAPSVQELMRRLREAKLGGVRGRSPTRLVVVAHVDSLHERVVAALDAGATVGMEEVQLVTIEEDF